MPKKENEVVDVVEDAEPKVEEVEEYWTPVEVAEDEVEELENTVADTSERDKLQVLSGDTPVKYRYVFEFHEPIKLSQSGPKVDRIELFGSSDLVFFALQAVIGRLLPRPDVLKRAQAIILTPESSAIWEDRNPNEEV